MLPRSPPTRTCSCASSSNSSHSPGKHSHGMYEQNMSHLIPFRRSNMSEVWPYMALEPPCLLWDVLAPCNSLILTHHPSWSPTFSILPICCHHPPQIPSKNRATSQLTPSPPYTPQNPSRARYLLKWECRKATKIRCHLLLVSHAGLTSILPAVKLPTTLPAPSPAEAAYRPCPSHQPALGHQASTQVP